MTYAIAVLVLLLGLSGWGLKSSLEHNAVLEKTVQDQTATITAKKKELSDLNEVLANREVQKEIVYRDKEVVRYKIREVKSNADPEACINQPVPVDVECLFVGSGCDGLPGDTSNPGDGNTDTSLPKG